MHIELPLDKMSLSDKLEVMEALWESLSSSPQNLPSPEWHRNILLERKNLAEEKKLQFNDWDTAFKQLKDELREDSNP